LPAYQQLDPYRKGKSIIHKMDARVKFILTLAFILTCSLVPHGVWFVYPLLLTIVISAAILAEIGIGYVLKRSVWALPFVLAAFPLIFTMDGPTLTSFHFLGINLTISVTGVERLVSILFKSWFSIQAAIILVTTTRFEEIVKSMRWLKVPKLLVAIINLMWRYIFVLVTEVKRLLIARASRSSILPDRHGGGTVFWRAKVAGYMAGNLFLRSIERSDRVYAAMLSRGYDGDIHGDTSQPLSGKNWTIIFGGLVLLFMMIGLSLIMDGIL